MDLGGVDTLRCGYSGELNLGGIGRWVFRRTKSGRRWIWEALIRLDVGAPMVFVSGDIQYVKRRKFDQIHVSLRFFFVGSGRDTLRCWYLGELNLGGVGSGRR